MKTLLDRNQFRTSPPGEIATFLQGLQEQTQEYARKGAGQLDGAFAPKRSPRPEPRPINADGTFSDAFAGYGFADNVPRSLISTESGGNWRASNQETGSSGREGHFGILQFGQDRLDDARRAGVIPADMTPEQFLQSEPAQIAATNWHFADIDERIRSNGLDRYVGQEVGGVPMSWNGMRAMAHLGGFNGMVRFLRSGGKYNPSDSFGTSLAMYGRRHRSPF